ncbi:MAG TPA: OB-fold domain-containing protein [Acidimicrobiia bacterium]|nr:OB-fold domain-containing protein [Acidimicrobiia bacterium]
MSDRLLPAADGLNGEFYGFLARGELRLQRCTACAAWRHPPRFRCATCGSAGVAWERASGRGRVYSWTVTHRAVDPAFTPPYAILVVELDEGPRLVGNLRGVEPSELVLDLPVVVEIEAVSDTVGLLWFSPA